MGDPAEDPHADYIAYMQAYRADLRARAQRIAAEARAARRKSRPRKPHATDEREAKPDGRAKITLEDVRSIRRRHAAGENRNVLASEFGITPRMVNQISARRRWAHVPD